MRVANRLPGNVCGLYGYRSISLDGRDWVHEHRGPAPLRFIAARGGRVLTPPDRFVHDYASIPRFVWPLIGPPTGDGPEANYGPAAILHDWAYDHGVWDSGEPLTRKQADAIIWEACFDLNVVEWKLETIYLAVRIGGGKHWRDHRTGRIPCSTYGRG